MPEFEAMGDAATGALLGRAVEPKAGEGDGHTDEANCLNCGCALVGEYCHCCGQHAHAHRTVGAWWHDFLHSVLHLDGKFARTLPMLALRPGELTRRYIHGERAKFVSPLALFLFSVFLMFAIVSFVGGPFDLGSGTPQQDRAEATADLEQERAAAQAELAELEGDLREAKADGRSTVNIEARIAGVRRELKLRESATALALRLANEEEQREAGNAASGEEREREVNIVSKLGWPPLDRAIDRAERNPSLLLYKIQNNAYKFSWALIPISLPFLWMLFLHRRRYRQEFGAYEHLVFITYSLAFMSLGAILLAVLRPLGIGDAIIGSAIAFVPPVHIFIQLRGAYGLSKWSALWRTAVLLVAVWVALGLFLALLLAVGVFG